MTFVEAAEDEGLEVGVEVEHAVVGEGAVVRLGGVADEDAPAHFELPCHARSFAAVVDGNL